MPRAALHAGAAAVGRLKPEIGRQLRASLAMDAMPGEDDTSMIRDFPDLQRLSLSQVLEARSQG